RKTTELDASDVEPIARGQVRREDEAAAAATDLAIRDTDLVSTVVYSHHYYGFCPDWVEQAARARLGDLYVLLHPDVPWVADGLQRDRPQERAQIHALFRRRLESFGAAVVDITGTWQARTDTAIAAIVELQRRRADGQAADAGAK
ncbi:MAG: ATP-binding protein, partial [Acidobacteria bacterium]|nr:ATP-binding protein [Acidobacteriota bacterium]